MVSGAGISEYIVAGRMHWCSTDSGVREFGMGGVDNAIAAYQCSGAAKPLFSFRKFSAFDWFGDVWRLRSSAWETVVKEKPLDP